MILFSEFLFTTWRTTFKHKFKKEEESKNINYPELPGSWQLCWMCGTLVEASKEHQYLLWRIPVKFSSIYTLRITKYSWCLNNIRFSCAVHWDTDYFSVQTTVLHHPHLAKSADGEPWLWRNNFKVIYKFVIVRRVFTLSPHVILIIIEKN